MTTKADEQWLQEVRERADKATPPHEPTLETLVSETVKWLEQHAPLHSQGWHLAFALKSKLASSQAKAVTRAHVEGCPKNLSVPVDICPCGGRDIVWANSLNGRLMKHSPCSALRTK